MWSGAGSKATFTGGRAEIADRLVEGIGKGQPGQPAAFAVLLTDGIADQVGQRLTGLVGRPEVEVSAEDRWQPQGTRDVREAELDKLRKGSAVSTDRRDSPAVAGVVAGRGQGQVEDTELGHRQHLHGLWQKRSSTRGGEGALGGILKGRQVRRRACQPETDRERARGSDRRGCERRPAVRGGLSVEHHFQLANRFAWSWKLATLGVPVVLVYLGFLDAVEMTDKRSPFGSDDDWKNVLLEYCRDTIDAACWETTLDVRGTPLLPLMRSDPQPFEPR